MAIEYYPRIDDPAAIRLISDLVKKTPVEAQEMATTRHDHQYYYPTAAQFVSEETLTDFRNKVINMAGELGFPHSTSSDQRRTFDQEMSYLLSTELELIPAEAANQEIWNFLTLVLLPDVAKWRYPNPSNVIDYSRWLGGHRNVFRKLWWREVTLGRKFNRELGEDEAVGIMERPLLGGQAPVARAMVSALLKMEEEFPDQPRSELMRAGAVNLRRYTPFTAFEFYSEEQIEEFVLEVFRSSSAAYAKKKNARFLEGNTLVQVEPPMQEKAEERLSAASRLSLGFRKMTKLR